MAKQPVSDPKKKVGEGFNDARGEIPDMKDTPKHNGQNVNNDPAHLAEREKRKSQSQENERAAIPAKMQDGEDYKAMEDSQLKIRRNK